ncbi:MAG: zinc ribbon domain-containing protein [Candidatus Heimdallarchaeota archaeon]|nr:zinc ribbon domain-containing protein [Candidatus Heimdallarchaeota archaeon]
MPFCDGCGFNNTDGTQYCSNCGKQITQQQAQQGQQGYQQQPQQGGYGQLGQFNQPQQGFQQPMQGGYKSQDEALAFQYKAQGQVFRPTGITILMVLTGIGLAFSLFGIGSIFDYGAVIGIISLVDLAVSGGVFFAMYGMKKWGVKFILIGRGVSTALSGLSAYVLTPMMVAAVFEGTPGYTDADIEMLSEIATAAAIGSFWFGAVITALILWYVYSKKDLFIHD